MPDILLLQCEELAVIDNLSGKLYLIVYADPAQPEAYSARASSGCANCATQLRAAVIAPPVKPRASARRPEARVRQGRLPGRGGARQGIHRRRRHDAGADRPAHRASATPSAPLSLYRALRSLNPSPYMYYYDFGDFHVVGASPEILVRQRAHARTSDKVTIRPLAGTRPRGATPEQDAALEAELLADPKERAEHLMLIDLARNDIGRIAQDRQRQGDRGISRSSATRT